MIEKPEFQLSGLCYDVRVQRVQPPTGSPEITTPELTAPTNRKVITKLRSILYTGVRPIPQ